MCIICNVAGPDMPNAMKNTDVAMAFLHEFSMAQQHMKAAAAKMLEVSKIAVQAEDRARYDMIHKEMVRQIREWNKLEEKREHSVQPPVSPAPE